MQWPNDGGAESNTACSIRMDGHDKVLTSYAHTNLMDLARVCQMLAQAADGGALSLREVTSKTTNEIFDSKKKQTYWFIRYGLGALDK